MYKYDRIRRNGIENSQSSYKFAGGSEWIVSFFSLQNEGFQSVAHFLSAVCLYVRGKTESFFGIQGHELPRVEVP
jgi:hypothetical protein